MSRRSIIVATASYDSTIRLWEAQTGQCNKAIPYIQTGQRTDLHVNRIEITPDQRKLAAACNPNIQLYDVNSNYPHHPERTFRTDSWKSNNVMAVGFQNDGNIMFSGSEDGKIKIWDLRAPDCQKEYGMASSSQSNNGTFSDSQKYYGKNVSDSRNYGILSDCQKEYTSGSSVNTVVLHPNQTELISGDQNGSIRVWDLRADSCSSELIPEIGKPIQSLSVMSDGTMVVAANTNGTCFVWKCLRGTQTVMTKFEPLQKIQAHNGYILKCLFSPQNKYLATASSDKTVKIWNVNGFKLEKVLIGHQRWIWDCNFSKDGEFLLTASSDMTARLWSMRAGKEVMVFKGHEKATVSCAFRE